MIPMAIIISRTGFAGSRARASRGCLTARYASHSGGLILKPDDHCPEERCRGSSDVVEGVSEGKTRR